jgi:hypothetical protein
MLRTVTCAFVFGMMAAGSAFADCAPAQDQEAGKIAASKARAIVESAAPVEGKQMINLVTCDFRAGKYNVEFRYNFMGAGGYNWVEGRGSYAPDGSGEFRVTKSSPGLQAAAEAKGVNLASR